MKFGVFRKFGALNSVPVFDAITRGIERKGWKVSESDLGADVAVIWSVLWDGRMQSNQRIYEKFKRMRKPILILEVGCLNRGNLWKVSLNHINGAGCFGPTNNSDDRRKKLNINLKPWKQGSKIVICGQHPKSEQWNKMPDPGVWINQTVDDIRKHTDREILIRPHPRAPVGYTGFEPFVTMNYPAKLNGTYDSYDFEHVLNDAWAVINWNSNPATVAVLNGVPSFVGPDNYAAPVSSQNLARIESPYMPEREQWANDLAYTEWTTDEIASGEPLDRLEPFLKL